MKVCNTEIMKMIKELEEQKSVLLKREEDCCTVSYKEGESKLNEGYNYQETRVAVRNIDSRVRYLRSVLARANCNVKVDSFDITIGEALTMLAQLQNERAQLEFLARHKQLSRRITPNGIVEFTECAFDTAVAEAEAKAIRKKINDLQIQIDRANLTNFVDID